MPELRKDPITGRWIIISTERASRPADFISKIPTVSQATCPFCPGRESSTPPEVLAYRAIDEVANQPGWSVRVVPNMFPALMPEGDLAHGDETLFDHMNGIGAHEVIIETPEHDRSLADVSEAQLESVLSAFRDRMVELKKDERFRYLLVFKNHGEAAGATREHPHSQLIALPIVPQQVQEELDGAKKYFGFNGRCIYCDIIRQELDWQIRIINQTGNRDEGIVALAPYAPRFAFETWLLPTSHQSAFEDASSAVYANLAKALKVLVSRMNKILRTPPYNLVIHTSSLDETRNSYYHWHLEVMPRTTQVAGLELGAGCFINSTPPEESARLLREAACS